MNKPSLVNQCLGIPCCVTSAALRRRARGDFLDLLALVCLLGSYSVCCALPLAGIVLLYCTS